MFSQRSRYALVSVLAVAMALLMLTVLHQGDLASVGWALAAALAAWHGLTVTTGADGSRTGALQANDGLADGGRGPATSPTDPARLGKQRRVAGVLRTRSVDMALQPIVSLANGRVVGVEALARFRDGRGPGQWFADAGACGRASELDELAFTSAMRLLPQVPTSAYLSVNADPGLLIDPGFQQRLMALGVPLQRLVIEMTEHTQVCDYTQLTEAVALLRAEGVRFAIDDTGAGYASLQHVLQLRPDIIKLDRSLITGLDTDRARRSLITALVLLALDIGATLVGEGVETPGEFDALATLGVDHAQGFWLAQPTIQPAAWQHWWSNPWAPAHHLG